MIYLPPAQSCPVTEPPPGHQRPRHPRVTGPPPATAQGGSSSRRYGAGNAGPNTTAAAGRVSQAGRPAIRSTSRRPGDGACRSRRVQETMITLASRHDVPAPDRGRAHGRSPDMTVTSNKQCRILLVHVERRGQQSAAGHRCRRPDVDVMSGQAQSHKVQPRSKYSICAPCPPWHSGVVILGSNCLAIATQIHLGDHNAANEAGHRMSEALTQIGAVLSATTKILLRRIATFGAARWHRGSPVSAPLARADETGVCRTTPPGGETQPCLSN
jgi:hypothetical protein